MQRKRIGIVGYGVVGRSLHRLFGEDAVTLDADATDEDRAAINACDFVFICVPTPVGAGGHCNTSIVEECVRWIDGPEIIIRSTVAPGTTERLRRQYGKGIIFQPEYIGETPSHPLADVRKHTFVILGGPRDETSRVADLYQRYYHSEVRFYFTDSRTAEVAKYMENSFYAVKVMFCNEFYDIARAHGVDYNELREIWLADPRISRDHTFVYPDNRGFSGKCLPKDVTAIIASSRQRGFEPRLLEILMEINEEYRADDGTYIPYRRENVQCEAPAARKTSISRS
ncbi:MAG: UDP-glucose/GDP-mannose dehydrogenase family protein [Planctomycetes bacterium]|nr:UDP-glucose/GDP-mannose dehydrogenase family protein [Planctomycetota bacterium]